MVADIFPSNVTAPCSIKIEDYILENYSPAKLPERYLEVGFSEIPKSTFVENGHGQQKCSNISFPFARSPVAKVYIASTQKLVTNRQSEAQAPILQLTLNTADSLPGVEFQPGDTIGILASNSEVEVNFVLRATQLEADAQTMCIVKLKSGCLKKSAKVPAHIPEVTTPREILRDCLSLRAVTKKQFLRALAECCTAPNERQFLSCLSSKEGADFYNSLILEKGYTLLDFLALCPTCCPSLALLVEQLPRMLPRPYSIANSPLKNNAGEIKIVFSVLPQRPGVVTGMLHCLSEEVLGGGRPFVHLFFRETSRFRYSQEDVGKDCILIGVGTGVAPFLGFLEHKQLLMGGERKSTELVGKTWLFSGSKSQNSACARKDFQEFKSHGILDGYFEAFSRVDDWPAKYVQDLLLANCEEFVEFFIGLPESRLYVCADRAKISKSIEAGIKQCLMQSLAVDETQATELIKGFRRSGKYSEDLWT